MQDKQIIEEKNLLSTLMNFAILSREDELENLEKNEGRMFRNWWTNESKNRHDAFHEQMSLVRRLARMKIEKERFSLEAISMSISQTVMRGQKKKT